MKLFISSLIAILLMATASFAEKPVQFKVGDISLIPISDRQGEGNTDNLIGYSAENKAKLTPDGKVNSYINTFLLISDGKYILIDTGLGEKGGATLKALTDLGIKPEQISYVILTHLHIDHINGLLNNGKATFPNATVMLSQQEDDFWFNNPAVQEKMKSAVTNAKNALAPYKEKVKTFKLDGAVIAGITSVGLIGHTMGQSGLMIESKGERLLIVADLVHVADVQFALPEVYSGYDYDGQLAIKTRKAILEKVATDNITIAGMHLPYPAIGKVSKDGNGYIFKLSSLQ